MAPDAGGPAPPLWRITGRRPDDVAVEDRWRSCTWRELEEETNAFGHGLLSSGLVPGDHVVLVATNRIEFVVALLGAQRAGMVISPLKSGWTPWEIGTVVEDARTGAVVTDLDNGRQVAADHRLPLIDLAADHRRWLERHHLGPHPVDRRGWKMSFTSGTTGRPKGVVAGRAGRQTFTEAFTALRQHAERFAYPQDAVHLVVSQLFHGAPTTFALGALAAGIPMRIVERWDADRALGWLADDVGSTVMVPTMFRQLLVRVSPGGRTGRPGRLGAVVHGGEPCPIELKSRMVDWWGSIFHEYFGFTEGGFAVCTTEEWQARPGTVGRAVGGEIVILDEAGRPLPPGQEGGVYFRPTGTGFRYLDDPDKTAAAYVGNAFTAGDIGWLDDDGYLFVSGRRAEVIVSAGVNVYPAEVEQALSHVPGLLDIAVVGGPDAERGEAPVAVIVPVASEAADDVVARVEVVASEQLARYKRPVRVLVRDALPRDGTGKLLRTVLRDELWGAATGFAVGGPRPIIRAPADGR